MGDRKVCFVAHFDGEPGLKPRDLAKAIESLGLSFTAINAKGQKQAPFSMEGLEAALARHATAKYGATTELLERPKVTVHTPGAFLRLDTSVRDERTSASENRFPPVLTVFWPAEVSPPRREHLDAFVERLASAAPVRVAAAGFVWAGPERPMLKSAHAVAEQMLAQFFACPHAHSNHRAKLDSTTAALEPGSWNYFGSRHLARLGARRVEAERLDLGEGASFALFDEPPLESSPDVIDAYRRFARSIGPLSPAVALSELLCGLSIPKEAGFGLTRWLARYHDDTRLPRSSPSGTDSPSRKERPQARSKR